MAANMEWRDSVDVIITVPPVFSNVVPGVPTSPIELHLWNNKDGVGADPYKDGNIFNLAKDAGGPTFTFTTSPTTGGLPTAFGLDITAVVLNDTIDRLTIDVHEAMLSSFLNTAVSNATGCDTDPDVDVRLYLFHYK